MQRFASERLPAVFHHLRGAQDLVSSRSDCRSRTRAPVAPASSQSVVCRGGNATAVDHLYWPEKCSADEAKRKVDPNGKLRRTGRPVEKTYTSANLACREGTPIHLSFRASRSGAAGEGALSCKASASHANVRGWPVATM
jgi:hypothetical protein